MTTRIGKDQPSASARLAADPSALDMYLGAFHESDGYLNFASFGPPSDHVAATTDRLMNLSMNGGPDSTALLSDETLRAREAFARLSGFPCDGVTLVPSTSLGLFQVAFGIDSGTVLVSSGEFPANLYPWWRSGEIGRARPRILSNPDSRVTPQLIADSLTPDVVAVSVSAVDFRTGFQADLAAIRDVLGPDRLLIVDGIQSFGVAATDWSVADALVVGGQKWIRAGWGCAALALSIQGLERIKPLLGGWAGVENPYRYDGQEHQPLPDAGRFTQTNPSPVACGAFASALELLESATVEQVESRIKSSVDVMLNLLDRAGIQVSSPRDAGERAGIVVARIPNGRAANAHATLTAAGTSCTLHGDDRIRFSVHATTSRSALEAAATMLQDFAR